MAHLSLRKKFKTGNDKKRKISFLDDCYFSSPHTEMDSFQGPEGDDKKFATRKDNDSDGAHASPRRIMLMQVLQAEIRGKFNRAWVGRLSDQYLSARESCRIGELYNFSQSPAGTGGVGGHPFDVPAPNPRAKFVSCLDFSTTDVLLSGKCSGHVSIQCTSAATRVYDSLSAWIRELGEDNEDEPSIPKDTSPSFCELSLSSELRVFFPVGHTSALQKRERKSLHTVCRDEMSGLFRPQISLSTNQRVEEVRWDPSRLGQFAMVSSTSHCLQTYDANAPNSGPHASYPQARCFSQRRGMQDFCFIDNLKVVAAGCDGGVHVDARARSDAEVSSWSQVAGNSVYSHDRGDWSPPAPVSQFNRIRVIGNECSRDVAAGCSRADADTDASGDTKIGGTHQRAKYLIIECCEEPSRVRTLQGCPVATVQTLSVV